MTNNELIEKLKSLPENKEIMIAGLLHQEDFDFIDDDTYEINKTIKNIEETEKRIWLYIS